DGHGEALHHAGDGLFDARHLLGVGAHAGGAVGHEQERVIGRGVAVHGGAVVAPTDAGVELGGRRGGGGLGVGNYDAEGGGHRGGAVGQAGEGGGTGGEAELGEGRFGREVGGHDRVCGVGEAVGAQAGDQGWESVDDLARVEFHTDDAGGGGQHLGGRQA